MRETTRRPDGRHAEGGFTLVEALVAMIVLIFGLMAVTNLLLVAASSNTVANQGTGATTSATRVMDMLKATSFTTLNGEVGGGTTFAVDDGGKACEDPTLVVDDWHCTESLAGVGQVHTHWWIEGTDDNRMVFIRVRSEGVGALTARRSRSEFTTFRSCTDMVNPVCPLP